MIQADNRLIPSPARVLGYAGVLPFATLALVHVFGGGDISPHALRAFLVYSALILSFLGGIRWGVATRFDRLQAGALTIAVLPSLWAFACLLWPDPSTAVWGLLVGFIILGLADWLLPAQGSAIWMTDLRARLSIAVVACHGVMITSLMVS
jgi:hypothetical protein